MFWIYPSFSFLKHFNKRPKLYGFLLAALLVNFPSTHISKVNITTNKSFDLPEELEAGSPIIIEASKAPFFENLEFSKIGDTNKYLAVVSVYSRDSVFVNYETTPYASWREGIKRLFRPAEVVWNRQKIDVKKRSLKKSNNLRLPSSVLSKLSQVDKEKKKAEWLKAYNILSASNGELRTDCLSYPVHSKVVSQYGKPRRLPSGKKYYHTGLDLRAWYGTPIRSAGNAVLVLKEHMTSPGNNVILDHGGGLYTRYMHFSKFGNIEMGKRVPAGTVIGYSGSTGRSQAPHLHWEIIWKGNHASPERFLQSWEQICDLK